MYMVAKIYFDRYHNPHDAMLRIDGVYGVYATKEKTYKRYKECQYAAITGDSTFGTKGAIFQIDEEYARRMENWFYRTFCNARWCCGGRVVGDIPTNRSQDELADFVRNDLLKHMTYIPARELEKEMKIPH